MNNKFKNQIRNYCCCKNDTVRIHTSHTAHSGPTSGKRKKKSEFIFENLLVESQDSRAFSASN